MSSAILDFYYTQLIGDPTAMPVIKASSTFDDSRGIGVIDADKYNDFDGLLTYGATNAFFRQVRNLVIDTTAVPANIPLAGIHWPAAQATSIQNVIFQLSQETGTQHVGIFMEGGSGGFLADLTFYGGSVGAQLGNQQYTARNLTFVECQKAIQHLWDWYWVYKGLTIVNCSIGIDVAGPVVGSAIILDSLFIDTPTAIATNASTTTPDQMPGRGSLVLENVGFFNVTSILQGPAEKNLIQNTDYDDTFITGKILVSSCLLCTPRIT